MTEQNNQGASVAVDIVKELFDAHPESVISPINSAAEALTWLEEIFNTIEKEALDRRSGCRIRDWQQQGLTSPWLLATTPAACTANILIACKPLGLCLPERWPAMTEKTIEQLREELRQAELWASVADAGLIVAENCKRVANDRLAAARLELQLAEDIRLGAS